MPDAATVSRPQSVRAPDDTRWAREPYPDYVAEVNRSIAFSGAEQSFFTVGKARLLLDLLRRQGRDPARTQLLDIGCGVGLIHSHLAASLGEMVGIDVAPDALEVAKAANPTVQYRSYNGLELPFADGTFDAASAICVMHHVAPPQWAFFVAEALRVLRPGGLFMVFEHNPWNPLTRLAVSRCAFDFDAALLSPPRLTKLLRETGFERVGREFLFFSPFSAAPIQSLENRLRWCPAGAQYVGYGRKI
jgi:SAM-dependent methyltransferase